MQIALRLLGIDALAAWVTVGQEHPLFLGASTLFLVGGGVRAIAGELEGGDVELALARPVSRVRYLLSWIAALVPGAAAIALAYSLGCIAAWELFQPSSGHLYPANMLESSVYTMLLLAAIAGASLLASSLSSERGRALAGRPGSSSARTPGTSSCPRGHAPSVRPPLPVVVLRPGFPHPVAGPCRGSTAACWQRSRLRRADSR